MRKLVFGSIIALGLTVAGLGTAQAVGPPSVDTSTSGFTQCFLFADPRDGIASATDAQELADYHPVNHIHAGAIADDVMGPTANDACDPVP